MWSECKRGGCPRRQCTTFISIYAYICVSTPRGENERKRNQTSCTFVRSSAKGKRGRFLTGYFFRFFYEPFWPRGIDIEKMGGPPQCYPPSPIFCLWLRYLPWDASYHCPELFFPQLSISPSHSFALYESTVFLLLFCDSVSRISLFFPTLLTIVTARRRGVAAFAMIID